MTSPYLQKQSEIIKGKKQAEAKDIAEAFRRSGIKKGNVTIPDGDIHRLPNQNFLVLSYCTADGATRVKSVKDLAMKFSTTWETQEEAEKWAQIIRDENPIFDVSVVDMYEWGTVPLPDDQRPFVRSVYANEILTKAMSGLQRSMIKGKKDMDDRKKREMAAAEKAMQRVKGKDYKMPEKSVELRTIEERIQKERDQRERGIAGTKTIDCAAAAETAVISSDDVKFTMKEITEIIMMYCKEHVGEEINPLTGAIITQFVAKRSLEIEAQIRRAKAAEFKDEDPSTIPTAQEVEDSRSEEAPASE